MLKQHLRIYKYMADLYKRCQNKAAAKMRAQLLNKIIKRGLNRL